MRATHLNEAIYVHHEGLRPADDELVHARDRMGPEKTTIRLILIQSNNVSCYRFSHLIRHLYVHDCFILVLYSGFTFHILLTHYTTFLFVI